MSPRPPLRRALAASLLAVALVACKPAPPAEVQPPNNGVAASLNTNLLMDAAFGAARQEVGQREVHWRAELMLPARDGAALDAASAASGADAMSAQATPLRRTAVIVTPRQVLRLNDETAALVFESQPQATASSGGDGDAPHYLGVAFFNRVPNAPAATGSDVRTDPTRPLSERWSVGRFRPYADVLVHDLHAIDSQVYKLAPDRYLLALTLGRCNAVGACERYLNGYLVQPDGLALALQTPLAGNNLRAHTDCAQRLAARSSAQPKAASTASAAVAAPVAAGRRGRPARARGSAASEPRPASDHACYDVTGEISPISREAATADVSIRYRGAVSDVFRHWQRVQQTQLYRLQDGFFVQIDGTSAPIPPL